jgi:polysaccharide export outer membrane protein
MEIMKLFGRGMTGLGFILVCILLAGCQSGKKPGNDGYGYDPLSGDPATAAMSTSSGLPGSASGAPAATSSKGAVAGQSSGSFLNDLDRTTDILRPGDSIQVALNDIPTPPLPIEDTIKEDGSITLFFNEKFQAAGKTVHTLQTEIHDRYVTNYFRYMTPSVKTAERFFSVGGEVRSPNRYVWTAGTTVLSAIAMSGGFTDFSRKGRVIITRAGNHRQEYEDCVKALKRPELDLPIYPGDQVFVKKRIW